MANDSEPVGIIELEGDLADAEKPPEIPAGMYTAEVQDVQTPVSNKGNKYFAIKCVIAPDDLPPDLQEFYDEGAILFWNRNVVPQKGDRRAMYNLRKLVEALGLVAAGDTINPDEWMGRKLRVRVAHTTYEGETRAEIKSIEAAETGARRRSTSNTQAPVEEAEEAEQKAAPSRRQAARANARSTTRRQ